MIRKDYTVTLALVAVLCTSCIESGPEAATVIPLDPVATSRAPLSGNSSIALANEATACAIDSYEDRIHCMGRSGEEQGAFGRPGEGPGEFQILREVVGGPDGTIGAIDWGLARMTVFETTGTLISEMALPPFGAYRASAPFGSTLFLYGMAPSSEDLSAGFEILHWEFDLASETIVWERAYSVDLVDTGCDPGPLEELARGVPTPAGGIVLPGMRRAVDLPGGP